MATPKTSAQEEAAKRKGVTVEGVQFEAGMADGMDAKAWKEWAEKRFYIGHANQAALIDEAFKKLTEKQKG